jgi:16S rRNA (cytosine967-C5)-methyltransferase
MKKSGRSPRYLAIEILCSWEDRGLPLDQLMEDHIANATLADPRDRQLIMSMVYGVIRWRGYLDWLVEKFSKHPLAKIKNRTLQALRLGIFQLLFLDRVPASAAINETVQALKDMKQPKWVTGYVNGVLRSIDRERRNIPDPQDAGNSDAVPEAALLSHPEWLIKRWKNRYGSAAAITICRQNNRIAPLCLRVNTTLTSAPALLEKLRNKGLPAAAGKFSPLAIKLDAPGAITAIPGFADGLFQVQDEAAQLVSMLLGPLQRGKSYLDGCSGLGGKTSHLAQMLAAGSRLVAIEPNTGRIRKLQENLARLRLDTTVTIVEGTLGSLLPDNKETFAGILIDAPCSGLGVLRHHPDIRWNRGPDDLLRYQEKQLDLLKDAAQLVALQGILVYATCSTEPEENDAVIKKFLAAHPGFILSDCRDMLPESAACLVDSQGFFRTLPGQDDLAGFFAARLVKI